MLNSSFQFFLSQKLIRLTSLNIFAKSKEDLMETFYRNALKSMFLLVVVVIKGLWYGEQNVTKIIPQ